jgi:hypothetical protein
MNLSHCHWRTGPVGAMSKADYRDNAKECLRVANAVTNPSTRASLLQMAQAWLKLYDQALRNSETDITYETPPPRLSIPQQQQQKRNKSEN